MALQRLLVTVDRRSSRRTSGSGAKIVLTGAAARGRGRAMYRCAAVQLSEGSLLPPVRPVRFLSLATHTDSLDSFEGSGSIGLAYG